MLKENVLASIMHKEQGNIVVIMITNAKSAYIRNKSMKIPWKTLKRVLIINKQFIHFIAQIQLNVFKCALLSI